MVYCSGCGAELPSPDADVCTHCGRLAKEKLRLMSQDENTSHRSAWWYLLPIFFSIIGGVIAYFVVKGDDPKLARNCLILGFIITLIGFVFGVIVGMMMTPVMMI